MCFIVMETATLLVGQRDEIEGNNSTFNTRSGDLFFGEKHEMAVAAAARLREMDEEIASLSTSDLREPLHSSVSDNDVDDDDDDDMVHSAQVDITYHTNDLLVSTAREIVQTAINNAVTLCEYVDTILKQALHELQSEVKESGEDTLKSPQAVTTYEERYATFRSDSSSSSDSTHEHTVDRLTLPSVADACTTAELKHDHPTVDHKHKLLHSDSSSDDTPVVEVTRNFKLVKIAPVIHSSLDEDTTSTPIIELNHSPTCIVSTLEKSRDEKEEETRVKQTVEEQESTEKQTVEGKQNIEEKQSIQEKQEEGEETKNIEEKRNIEQTRNDEEEQNNYTITILPNNSMDNQTSLGEKEDSVGELKANGEIKINVIRHDDGSLSPEPSFAKVLMSAPSSKSMRKADTLDGRIFGNFCMHQSDSLPSFPSATKVVDPDAISLVINQCNEEDMEHSDEDILIAHSMDSTSFIDEYLDTASVDSTNFSQESRDNLVFPNSPVALRHNKESIVRRRYDAGRFDETSPVKEEEKNGFEEFAELFERTFQLSRNQRERSSSPHSNKVTSVFVLEGSHTDENAKVSIEGLIMLL